MFQSPGDVLFRIGDFPVYYYGLTMALACITGVSVAYLIFKNSIPTKIMPQFGIFQRILLLPVFWVQGCITVF